VLNQYTLPDELHVTVDRRKITPTFVGDGRISADLHDMFMLDIKVHPALTTKPCCLPPD
jgi:hypothetical protein